MSLRMKANTREPPPFSSPHFCSFVKTRRATRTSAAPSLVGSPCEMCLSCSYTHGDTCTPARRCKGERCSGHCLLLSPPLPHLVTTMRMMVVVVVRGRGGGALEAMLKFENGKMGTSRIVMALAAVDSTTYCR